MSRVLVVVGTDAGEWGGGGGLGGDYGTGMNWRALVGRI